MRHRVSNWSLRESLFVLLAACWLGASAWLGFSAPASATAMEAQVARGEVLFRRERCVFCHTVGKEEGERMKDGIPAASPSSSPFGPDLFGAGPRRTDDWQVAHLIEPGAVVGDSAMPSYAHLGQPDIAALVAFLQAQRPAIAATPVTESMPQIEDTLGNYRAGRSLYRAHCAGCHGDNGLGNGVVGHLLTPEPRNFTDVAWMSKQSDERLFAVIADGVPQTAMPGYRDSLSVDERGLLVRYLRYFADPLARQFKEQGLPLPASSP